MKIKPPVPYTAGLRSANLLVKSEGRHAGRFSSPQPPFLILWMLFACAFFTGTCRAAEPSAQKGGEQVINPHFTGANCTECHEQVPSPGDAALHLKFGGNDIALCNSCHDNEKARGDQHPVGIPPSAGDAVRIPAGFPLHEGNVTCRTCHDVYVQCKKMPAEKFDNFDFLRGAPYSAVTDMCFRCHDRLKYKKINPHEQLYADGSVKKQQCLYCHQSLPNANTVAAMDEVSFKTENAAFCSACHGREEHFHPAGAEHITTPSEKMASEIAASEAAYTVILPLFEGRIFCGTCHNPHAEGVITRPQAAKGSGAKLKLRLDPSKQLCIACHREKDGVAARDVSLAEISSQNNKAKPAEVDHGDTFHKAFVEQNCRACHQVTRQSPERPTVYKMCFQADCHKTDLLQKTYRHEEALSADCLLCHSPHGSTYSAHILKDQKQLCKACHPLLLGRPEQGARKEAGDDLHDYYYGVFARLMPGEQMTCAHCHGKEHREAVREKGIAPCFQCHNYLEMKIRSKRGRTKNIHETMQDFEGNRCTLCHDPHSSPYPALLKKERNAYATQKLPPAQQEQQHENR